MVRPTIVVDGPLVTMPKRLRVVPASRPSPPRHGRRRRTVPSAARESRSGFHGEMAAVAGEPAWDVTVRYAGKPDRHGQVYT